MQSAEEEEEEEEEEKKLSVADQRGYLDCLLSVLQEGRGRRLGTGAEGMGIVSGARVIGSSGIVRQTCLRSVWAARSSSAYERKSLVRSLGFIRASLPTAGGRLHHGWSTVGKLLSGQAHGAAAAAFFRPLFPNTLGSGLVCRRTGRPAGQGTATIQGSVSTEKSAFSESES